MLYVQNMHPSPGYTLGKVEAAQTRGTAANGDPATEPIYRHSESERERERDVSIYVYTYICIHTCICTCVYVYACVYMYTYMYVIYIYICVYIYIHMCVRPIWLQTHPKPWPNGVKVMVIPRKEEPHRMIVVRQRGERSQWWRA